MNQQFDVRCLRHVCDFVDGAREACLDDFLFFCQENLAAVDIGNGFTACDNLILFDFPSALRVCQQRRRVFSASASTASLRALASASVMSRSASASPKILDVIFSILILFSAFPSVFRHSDIRSVSLYRYSQPDQYGNQQREDRVGFYHRGINDTLYHLIRSFGCQLQRRRGCLTLRDT